MKNTSNNYGGGIGFGGMLTILFIGLKLCDFIDWSWWWVLSPLWISAGIFAALVVVFIAIGIIVNWVK